WVRSVPSSCEPGASTATIFSPSTSTSACPRPVAETTVPPVISVVAMLVLLCAWRGRLRLGDAGVAAGAAVADELRVGAHLARHVHVEGAHEHLFVCARAALADEVAARVDDLAGAVELDGELAVLVVFAPHPVGLQ